MKKTLLFFLISFIAFITSCDYHIHNFQLKYNNIEHFYECNCGEIKDEEIHHQIWKISKYPTVDEVGKIKKICDKCDMFFYDRIYSIYEHEGVYASTINSVISPIIEYQIGIIKDIFNYNEEIEISLSLICNSDMSDFILDGPLSIKIEESPFYEIIGENEIIIENLNQLNNFAYIDEDYPIKMKFKIKVTNPAFLINNIKIKLKFNADIDLIRKRIMPIDDENNYIDNYFWYNLNEEYFYHIDHFYFITDSQGIIFSHPTYPLGNADPLYRILYESLNREYNAGLISKDEYISKLIYSTSNNKYYIKIDNNYYFSYLSNNIRAKIYISEELNYLYEKYKNGECSQNEIAKELIGILFNNNLITLEMFQSEIEFIDEIIDIESKLDLIILYNKIPFDNFDDLLYEYILN